MAGMVITGKQQFAKKVFVLFVGHLAGGLEGLLYIDSGPDHCLLGRQPQSLRTVKHLGDSDTTDIEFGAVCGHRVGVLLSLVGPVPPRR